MPLAQKYNAGIVGLTISEKGIPATASERVEIAANIIAQAMELGISPDDVYIDPVVLPVNVAQAQCPELLYALRDCKLICSPSPKTVVGLSNVSQGTKTGINQQDIFSNGTSVWFRRCNCDPNR